MFQYSIEFDRQKMERILEMGAETVTEQIQQGIKIVL